MADPPRLALNFPLLGSAIRMSLCNRSKPLIYVVTGGADASSSKSKYSQRLAVSHLYQCMTFTLPHTSLLHLWGLANRLYHFLQHRVSTGQLDLAITRSCTDLNHLCPDLLSALSHTDRHVTQERWVPHIAGVAVSLNVGRPLKLRGICVTGTYVAGLKLLELLLGAKFVCLR